MGLKALSLLLPSIREKTKADFVIANGENISKGKGLLPKDFKSLKNLGVDCVTLGNHYAGKHQTKDFIKSANRLIRPLNVDYPGLGSNVYEVQGKKIRVTSVLGRAFIKEAAACPFEAIDNLLKEDASDIHIVDFHAESTAEKAIFAHYVDGRVSAVLGTHTHVLTDDALILENGTAFLTDAGSTSFEGGVIGFDPKSAVERFVNKEGRISLAGSGRYISTGAIIEFAEGSRFPVSIETFKERIDVGAD